MYVYVMYTLPMQTRRGKFKPIQANAKTSRFAVQIKRNQQTNKKDKDRNM